MTEQSTWVSSLLKETVYSTEDQTLLVTFNNGAQYKYEGIEEAEYNSFREAESKGSFFSKTFRKKTFTKIEPIADDTNTDQPN